MDFHPADLLLHILNIIVTFVLLRLILWKPVNGFLDARKARVREELVEAERASAEAQALKEGYERQIGDIEEQGRGIMRESQLRASEDAQIIMKDAHEQAEHMLREAREKIENEKEQAIIAARYEIAQLATDMAARILKREVSAEDNKAVVEDFFREVR